MFLIKYDVFFSSGYFTYSIITSLQCKEKIQEGEGQKYRMQNAMSSKTASPVIIENILSV